MKYYIDIQLINSGINSGFILEKVYRQLHLMLVTCGENKNGVGIAFVDYGSNEFPLGTHYRLFAKEEQHLIDLNISHWLNRLSAYCQWSNINSVPNVVNGYENFKHVRIKSFAKKAKNLSKFKGISLEDAASYLKKNGVSETIDVPYVKMESQSSKKIVDDGVSCNFPLYVGKRDSTKLLDGKFDCYGLSPDATLPVF